MTNFIVRFPLKTEKYQEDILDKRFEIGRQIYNSLVNLTLCSSKAKQFYGRFYNKKKLSQRWNDFNGIKVQRDLYSAFLIMNVADDLKSFDMNKCNERFENFYRLHNLEVERLTGHKNLSSIGI